MTSLRQNCFLSRSLFVVLVFGTINETAVSTFGQNPSPAPSGVDNGHAPPPQYLDAIADEKLEIARKAVAEAIIAAQQAGRVKTTVSPPPILDVLVTGRAVDAIDFDRIKKGNPVGISPEVFGAWFTGYGTFDGINPQADVHIFPPSKGLKDYYDARARVFEPYLLQAAKAKNNTINADKPDSQPKPVSNKNQIIANLNKNLLDAEAYLESLGEQLSAAEKKLSTLQERYDKRMADYDSKIATLRKQGETVKTAIMEGMKRSSDLEPGQASAASNVTSLKNRISMAKGNVLAIKKQIVEESTND